MVDQRAWAFVANQLAELRPTVLAARGQPLSCCPRSPWWDVAGVPTWGHLPGTGGDQGCEGTVWEGDTWATTAGTGCQNPIPMSTLDPRQGLMPGGHPSPSTQAGPVMGSSSLQVQAAQAPMAP